MSQTEGRTDGRGLHITRFFSLLKNAQNALDAVCKYARHETCGNAYECERLSSER